MESIKTNPIVYIKRQLKDFNADADDIMAGLVKSFTTIAEFRDALCDPDTNECRFIKLDDILEREISGEILQTQQNKNRKTQFWRLHHKITKICKTPSETCDFEEVKKFYANRKYAMEQYKVDYPEENVDALITELEKITINGGGKQRGGKQKGGNWAQIVTLIAGIEVALSKVGSTASDAYAKLCNLCKKVFSFIYDSTTKIPECLRSLMGETLYKIFKNMAKGAIGAGVLNEVYQNIGNIINVLLSIVTYVPYAAGLVTMLSIGLVVFKLAEKLITVAPKLIKSAKTIVANAVNEIDAIHVDTIQSTVVDAITQKLKDSSDATKESIAQEMDDFKKTIHEILYNATLSPEAIAANKQLMREIDDRSAAMVLQIQANIAEHQQLIAANAMETNVAAPVDANVMNAPVVVDATDANVMNTPVVVDATDANVMNTPVVVDATDANVMNTPVVVDVMDDDNPQVVDNILPPSANTGMVVDNILPPSANTEMVVDNIPPTATKMDVDTDNSRKRYADVDTDNSRKRNKFDGKVTKGGKTHKKINKKTHKKSAAKHNKKSRKHRRSRKH